MGTTSEFVKLRASKNPKVGQWNIDYKTALSLAKKENKFIVTCWSNGDICGLCVTAEKCMMTDIFKQWMAKKDVYFVFQYSGDKDKGQTLHDWIFKNGGVKQYPGFRINLYDKNGKSIINKTFTGNTLRDNKTGNGGAKSMIAKLDAVFAKKPAPEKDDDVKPTPQDYKVRLNESLTTAQVNKILDAIDKNDGYCPCQIKDKDTKCHCVDFIKNKKFDEPCICKIYVKKQK